jgi:hypothetical protein
MRPAILAAILSLFAVSAATATPEVKKLTPKPKACEMSYDRAVQIGRSAIVAVQAGEFNDYSGADAKALLDEINSEPPQTTFAADHILVVELPGAPVVVALVNNGCEFVAFRADPAKWQAVKTRVLGQTL